MIISKKYRFEEKKLYEKDIKNLHDILVLHFEFWDKLFEIYYYCKDQILNLINNVSQKQNLYKLSCISIQIKQIAKKFLIYYQKWRVNEGCFSGAPSITKCVAGHAHGFDAVNRVFMLESILFNALNYNSQAKIFDNIKFTKLEIAELIDKQHPILIFMQNPVYKWSARMIMLQLRCICQRWNNLSDFLMNDRFLSALSKLLNQIQYRLYVIIDNASREKKLYEADCVQNEGVLADGFNGKIICTPQNNCGMSSITFKGSWLENLIMNSSRILTKLQNVIYMLEKLVSTSDSLYMNQLPKTFYSNTLIKRHQEFKDIIYEKADELLDTGQLQELITKSICLSIIGIDTTVRVSDSFSNDRSTNISAFEKARNIAPTGVCLYLDSFLRSQNKDYIFNSSISKYCCDISQIALLHTFEWISKKDGINPVGFINRYFIRSENLKEVESTVFKDFKELRTPFIVKVGANYIVCRGGSKNVIYCQTIIDALFIWGIILKKFNKWKIGKLNLKSIYKNIFHI